MDRQKCFYFSVLAHTRSFRQEKLEKAKKLIFLRFFLLKKDSKI
jgi:hypothetical protein